MAAHQPAEPPPIQDGNHPADSEELMVRTKTHRCLAAVVLATALLSTPPPATASPEPDAAGAAALQEGLWARLLAWLPEPPVALLDITSKFLSSADIDPNGRPSSTSSASIWARGGRPLPLRGDRAVNGGHAETRPPRRHPPCTSPCRSA